MTRRSGLGRGLSSLIPQAEVIAGGTDGESGDRPVLAEIPTVDVVPNPHQPRVHFDEDSLGELAASIAQLGVLQPILVRLVDGKYQLIAGERRWRAARRAGLDSVPAVVRTSDDVSAVEQALVENLHRDDLTPLEEAAAFQQLIEDFELTHDEIARRVGKSRSAITNTLRLLGLPPAVQHLLADGKLTAGHARALLGTPDRALQERLGARRGDGGVVRASRRGGGAHRGSGGADAGCATGTAAPDRRCRAHRRDPAATAGPPRARAAAGRRPGHPRRCPDGSQAGQGDDRVRRPRGSRADLPADHGRALRSEPRRR